MKMTAGRALLRLLGSIASFRMASPKRCRGLVIPARATPSCVSAFHAAAVD